MARGGFVRLAALLAMIASCAAEPDGDGTRIVPAELEVSPLPGGNGVLEVVALTLQRGADGTELFAAVKNTGDTPACDAAFSVELYDRAQQPLAAGIGGLRVQRFYALADEPSTIVGCVGPGDVAMASVADLPAELAIEDVTFAVYRCPYHALDVTPVDGLTVRWLRRAGARYTGTLVNDFAVAVRDPAVTIYLMDRAGRPLAATSSAGSEVIPAGGSWMFETTPVTVSAVDYVAYPAGALAPDD